MQSDLAEKMANLIEATHWVFCRGMQAGMAIGHKVYSSIMVRRRDNKLLLQYNMSGFPFITLLPCLKEQHTLKISSNKI